MKPMKGTRLLWRQRPHTVTAIWSAFGGELVPELLIECPYPPDEHEKPCRVWASEDDHLDTTVDGCWVQVEYDAIGMRDMTFEIPSGTPGPWEMMVHGSGDEGPQLTEVSMSNVPRMRWWHRGRR